MKNLFLQSFTVFLVVASFVACSQTKNVEIVREGPSAGTLNIPTEESLREKFDGLVKDQEKPLSDAQIKTTMDLIQRDSDIVSTIHVLGEFTENARFSRLIEKSDGEEEERPIMDEYYEDLNDTLNRKQPNQNFSFSSNDDVIEAIGTHCFETIKSYIDFSNLGEEVMDGAKDPSKILGIVQNRSARDKFNQPGCPLQFEVNYVSELATFDKKKQFSLHITRKLNLSKEAAELLSQGVTELSNTTQMFISMTPVAKEDGQEAGDDKWDSTAASMIWFQGKSYRVNEGPAQDSLKIGAQASFAVIDQVEEDLSVSMTLNSFRGESDGPGELVIHVARSESGEKFFYNARAVEKDEERTPELKTLRKLIGSEIKFFGKANGILGQ